MADTEECSDCGAVVSSMSKHRQWHDKVARRLRDLESETQRVAPVARRVDKLERDARSH